MSFKMNYQSLKFAANYYSDLIIIEVYLCMTFKIFQLSLH